MRTPREFGFGRHSWESINHIGAVRDREHRYTTSDAAVSRNVRHRQVSLDVCREVTGSNPAPLPHSRFDPTGKNQPKTLSRGPAEPHPPELAWSVMESRGPHRDLSLTSRS